MITANKLEEQKGRVRESQSLDLDTMLKLETMSH
jgi:hypothetical protein